MKFIDVHSHLDICKNIPQIVKECSEKDVLIVTCGIDSKSNRKAIELRKKFPAIKICLGIYPLDGLEMSDQKIEEEIKFIRGNKDRVVGVGEVGLDLHTIKDPESFGEQKKILGRLIDLAKELNKPVVVHSRDAEKEAVEFLEGFNYNKIVMHCFSGNMKLVKRIIDNGWILSIPASIKYNEHFQKIAEVTPIENLLCETDSPFLHPDRGKGNNSANVIESYKKISEIKGMSLEETEKVIFNNYQRIFGKV